MGTQTKKLIELGLLGILALGCGELEDPSVANTEEQALSVVTSGRSKAACGAALDPRKDRDHRFHKRCERYRQKGSHRDGRAGDVHVTTRALLDARGVTTIEATTGTLDEAAAPGRIERLAVEAARSCPRCRDNRSVTASGQGSGYVSTNVSGLSHGQSLLISATVSGIGRGTTRVSVTDEVHYRPDLRVGAIDIPSAPTVGVPTSIAATVREANGDEGATADCVLSVDGAAADRADAIWVDAGGMVTCHFTHTFTTAGSHLVAVDLVNVAPADFDASNGHAEVRVDASSAFTFSGSVVDSTYRGSEVEEVLDASGTVAYRREDTWGGRNQSASVTGTWPKGVSFPLASVRASATSAGATWPVVELGAVAGEADGSGMTCASGSDPTGYNWVGICTTSGDAAATQISVSAFAGDVTYHSAGVCQTTTAFYDCFGGYTWNSGSEPQGTVFPPIADRVTFGLSLVDAKGATLDASPEVPVTAFSSSDGVPRACQAQPDGTQHCTSRSYVETGVSGSVQ